jgi:hypothetical protein
MDDILRCLSGKLQEFSTHPDIERILMAKIRAWPHTDNVSFGADLEPTVCQAVAIQDSIGWKKLLYGRMSGFWQDAQHEWLVQMQPSGRRFFSGDLQFIFSNYSGNAKRKWVALIRAAQARRHSYHMSETRVGRAGMLTWLQM